MRAGDFSTLAKSYSTNRPDYSQSVLNALLGLLKQPVENIDFADVGAGTGIWTRMVCDRGPASVKAVEPNDEMRAEGIAGNGTRSILWSKGTAEQTGLPTSSCDWLTMASSLHWADFGQAIKEFHRVLRPKGRFTALWNPRLVESNPLTADIEEHLHSLAPDLSRVSSGRSGITNSLTKMLEMSGVFEDVVYLEGRHTILMTPERYLGAWRSVNDLQVQLGAEKFERFLDFVVQRIAGTDSIECVYLTRAWSARRKD